MRRTTLHRTSLHRTSVASGAAFAAAAFLLLAGCGSGKSGTATSTGNGSVPATPVSSPASPVSPTSPLPPTSPAPSAPPSPKGSGTTCTPAPPAQLTAADNGRTYCLAKGGQIRITLTGSKDRPWTPVTATGTALKAANPGIVIRPGDAVAAFDAVAPGTATLTSSRPLCAVPTAPGQVSCQGIQGWTVTVEVR
jgi:hypothetical protein